MDAPENRFFGSLQVMVRRGWAVLVWDRCVVWLQRAVSLENLLCTAVVCIFGDLLLAIFFFSSRFLPISAGVSIAGLVNLGAQCASRRLLLVVTLALKILKPEGDKEAGIFCGLRGGSIGQQACSYFHCHPSCPVLLVFSQDIRDRTSACFWASRGGDGLMRGIV